MAGFEKYQRFLNKTRKAEAYINLITNNNQNEACNTQSTDSCHTNILLVDERTPSAETSQEVYNEAKKNYKALQREIMKKPKLYLLPRGEWSLLTRNQDNTTLTFDLLRNLLLRTITDSRASIQLQWCSLMRCAFISRVVLVIVEGLGLDELAAIGNSEDGEELPTGCSEDFAEVRLKEEELIGNGVGKETLEKGEPPLKRQKGSYHDDDGKASPEEGENLKLKSHSGILSKALPLSSPLFTLHLNVQAPSQYSCDPVEEILCLNVKHGWCANKFTEGYDNLLEAAKENAVLLTRSRGMSLIENGFTPEVSLSVKSHKDNVNRLHLMMSLQEMIDFEYPLEIEGNPALQDPEFRRLHRVVEEVTPTSPMFGIDCEMCITARGSELTWVSVVDEQLKVVYTKYVRPSFHIINYLTKYSGVTAKHLAKISTTLLDVQKDLRRILPKDAILVGHHLSCDMMALKLFHPYVMDTSLMYNLRGNRQYRPSLKLLCKLFLLKDIQSSDRKGHNPSEDAAASLELALLKLRQGATFGDVLKRKTLPFNTHRRFRVEQEVLNEKRKSQHAVWLSEDYKLHLFMYTEKLGKTSALITTREGIKRMRVYLRHEVNNISTRVVRKTTRVLKVAHEFPQQQFLVCHCPMSENVLSPVEAKAELTQLDEQLASLRKSLPQNALVMTVFTGSSWSVPLQKRSNAVSMIDLIGQERWKYFR